MKIDYALDIGALAPALDAVFTLAGRKAEALATRWEPAKGAPVFTHEGRYTARGWTEWTQGFQFGCQLLVFEATGDERFFELAKQNTLTFMPSHLSHTGVHDHGFNTISTYGNLRRLGLEGRSPDNAQDIALYELAIKLSGAVQAMRWTALGENSGYIHSFNGPHSLFSDTIRSLRVLILAHELGHVLLSENDRSVSLLARALQHLETTARYNVYFGQGRDVYDVSGRVTHESIFNVTDGCYRCPSTQQGYSAFSTWTRGLGWIMLGAAELLEYLEAAPDQKLSPAGDPAAIRKLARDTAIATADFYIANTATDGIPYWDTGAPGLAQMGDYLERPSEPDNPWEPVDSSAAAITAQGLLRLGRALGEDGRDYWQAGLTVSRSLFQAPYLSEDANHEGLILHSVYHRPNGWDHIPPGKSVPFGESSLWGDYHGLELAVYLQRVLKQQPYLTFFGGAP